jgi:uncharacterized protein (TIGR03083 family)
VASDRVVLADLLATLSDQELHGPSLCAAWSVRDVGGHVLSMATTSKAAALACYLRTGADLDATNQALVTAATRSRSDEQLIDALRSTATARHTPPGLRVDGVLGEVVTHLADVALATQRPVGLPADHLTGTLTYLARRRTGNTRFTLTRHGRRPALDGQERSRGLRLEATDVAWSSGDGAVVRGPALALAAALAGRRGALPLLDGDGVAALRRPDR